MPCEVSSLTVQMTISPGSGLTLPCSEVIIETPSALPSLIDVSAALSRASSRRCLGFSPSRPGFPRASSRTLCSQPPSWSRRRRLAPPRNPGTLPGGSCFSVSVWAPCSSSPGYLRLSQPCSLSHDFLVALLTLETQRGLFGRFCCPYELWELLAAVTPLSSSLSPRPPGGGSLLPSLVERDGVQGVLLTRTTECSHFLWKLQISSPGKAAVSSLAF